MKLCVLRMWTVKCVFSFLDPASRKHAVYENSSVVKRVNMYDVITYLHDLILHVCTENVIKSPFCFVLFLFILFLVLDLHGSGHVFWKCGK